MGDRRCAGHCWIVDDSKVSVKNGWINVQAGTEIGLHSVKEINWNYPGDAVPAFLTLIMIPLTYKYVTLLLPRCFHTDLRGVLKHCIRRYRRYPFICSSQWYRLGVA